MNNELTYEQKVSRLDEILTRLDNSETPIDTLAEDVKEGARLIKNWTRNISRWRPRCWTPSRNWRGNEALPRLTIRFQH